MVDWHLLAACSLPPHAGAVASIPWFTVLRPVSCTSAHDCVLWPQGIVREAVPAFKRGIRSPRTYPVEAGMEKRKNWGLFMVTRSAAKQKMWSLSSYKPGFLTLKHGERAMRPWAFALERLLNNMCPWSTCLQGHRPHICLPDVNRTQAVEEVTAVWWMCA